MLFVFIKKGSPVYVVPACAGSRKGPTTLGLTYGTFPCILQEAVSKTRTHDLLVRRQQLYCCARLRFQFVFMLNKKQN
jgi:hypothetical protein